MELARRKSARQQVTRPLNEAAIRMSSEEVNCEDLQTICDSLECAAQALETATTAWIPLMELDKAEDEWATIHDYDTKVASTLGKLRRTITRLSNESVGCSENGSIINEQLSVKSGEITNRRCTRLPKLEIRKFNGEIENWLPFWELYKPTIHENEDLNEVEKFGYLMSYLTGDASKLLEGFTPTGSCYSDAIQLLRSEFAQESKVTEHLIDKLMKIPKVKQPRDLVGMKRLYNEIVATTRSLRALGIPPVQFVVIVKSVLLKGLPEAWRLCILREENGSKEICQNDDVQSAASSTSDTEDQVNRMLTVFKREINILEQSVKLGGMAEESQAQAKPKPSVIKGNMRTATTAGLFTISKEACVLCKSTQHLTSDCTANLTLQNKKEILKANRRCFRCTKYNHQAKDCRVKNLKCKTCKRNHASTMCDPEYNKQASAEKASTSVPTSSALLSHSNMNVYLKTAAVNVAAREGLSKLVRLVIDGGSETSFVTKALSNALQLPVVGVHRLRIQPFGSTNLQPAQLYNKVKLNLRNRHNGENVSLTAVEVPDICMDLFPFPNSTREFSPMLLADIDENDELDFQGINILIGSDQYWKVVTGELKRLTNELMAVKTRFGWTIHGSSEGDTGVTVSRVLHTQTEESCFDMSHLWNLDILGIKETNLEANNFLQNFMDNCIEFKDGRYEVRLPWLSDDPLSTNLTSAKFRLGTLLSKLRSSNKYDEYDQVIKGYLKEGIAEIVHDESNSCAKRIYYMPHRAVYRDDKETTRLRVVFDASSHVAKEPSLNDLLHTGVSLIPDLVLILLGFRMHTIAMSADIEKAFLQILLHPRDRDCHRFLWMFNDDVATYRMKRVTFGVRSSPFLLTSTIKKHLQQYDNPTARMLERSTYVDDVLLGGDDYVTALTIHDEAVNIFACAGMKLRKWHTNDERLRQVFDATTDTQKVLGIWWHLFTDELSVDSTSLHKYLQTVVVNSKRMILQAVSRLYDPLGMLNPYIISIKILLQDLWKERISWDETLNSTHQLRWDKWAHQLSDLERFCMRRNVIEGDPNVDLHIFCDASVRAYGAVAYVKGNNHCYYLMSRARVAPLKSTDMTLPKLELMAAIMGARLFKYVQSTLNAKLKQTFLWSDSKITLYWVMGKPERWKPYVANRVREIQTLTSSCVWKFCPGKENPADLLTRGINAKDLINEDAWKHGPHWLRKNEFEWPTDNDVITDEIANVFKVKVDCCKKVTYNVLLFIKKLQKALQMQLPDIGICLTTWREAERYWIIQTQGSYYETEIQHLKADKVVSNHSSLLKLNPFLDEEGIMRITGRLQFSEFDEDEKHPIILPKLHTLVNF